MNKIIKLIAVSLITTIVILWPTNFVLAKEPNSDAIKADYVLKEEGKAPQIVTVWKTNDYLAVAFNRQGVIGLWQNWSSDNPTFYQVYPQDAFRIEFSRMESEKQTVLLTQLKLLVVDEQMAEQIELQGAVHKKLHLSVIEEGEDVRRMLNSWSQFATYDYADIGDNEAIPELARLIHQGFASNF